MDNNENKSIMQMRDIYFSEISFLQNKNMVGEVNLNIDYSLKYERNFEDEKLVRVAITTHITAENSQLELKLVTIGIFSIEDSSLTTENREILERINTVAIMFPYIRSQVALITAQPGLSPIQLPIINVNKLVDSCSHN